ncbi:MAG: Acyl carrier protein phosphodiesterase [Marmoricola sp.]|nr:Acyl carrier protein phosphodiesterase [Marmoricola sp.]
MSLFRLDASIRVEGSQSRAIADIVEQEWRHYHPDAVVVRRDIGVNPIPANAWGTAALAGFVPQENRTQEQHEAMALAGRLTDELLDTDALLIASPLYNFGVSQHLKAWIDMVIADPRMGPGAAPLLTGKPAVLVTVRGGNYRAGTPREGWDHSIGWIRRVLVDVWQVDLKVVETDFTGVGVNPALDDFKEMAGKLRLESEEQARTHGRYLGEVALASEVA